MPLERYDDIEPEKERRRRKRITDLKVAIVMILLFFIALTLLMIWSDGEPISPSDEEGVKDASEEENGEFAHPTENEATTGQESQLETNEELFLKDEDGGFWIIEAFPVPEKWPDDWIRNDKEKT